VARKSHLEPRPAGNQDHLVTGERPADLQTAEKVPHAEYVLAVEYNLHAQRPLIMVFNPFRIILWVNLKHERLQTQEVEAAGVAELPFRIEGIRIRDLMAFAWKAF